MTKSNERFITIEDEARDAYERGYHLRREMAVWDPTQEDEPEEDGPLGYLAAMLIIAVGTLLVVSFLK